MSTQHVTDVKAKIQDITDDIKKIPSNPSIIGQVWKELWATFKKPILLIFAALIALLVLTPIVTYLFFVRDLSSKENILNHKNAGVILTDRNGKAFFNLYEAKSKNVISLSEIEKSTQQAVIATEDKDFYQHTGFSIQGIGRAVIGDVKEQQLAQGGSTITQQLIKNTLLTQEKNFLRKYQELFLAIEVERRFSKDDILEMYLNTVYFGEGAYGIEDAAHTYFDKKANELTLGESALLAAILPAPSAYSPISGDKDKAMSRQKLVLRLMEQQHYITKDEELQAENQVFVFNTKQEDTSVTAPHFALMVKQELIDTYGEQRVANSGFIVRTTIDLADQQFAEKTVKNQVANLSFNKVTNGAAIAIDPKTGEILALVGSHDWFDDTNGKINMVLNPRQPGSSFKPIVYTRALERKLITPATVLEDKAITYPDGYKPMNYDHTFRDNVLVRRALANSLNIPAVHVLEKVGIADTLEFAKDVGITSLKNPSDYGLSLVLGAGEVPLLQMTEAFGTFANNGSLVKPTTILEIKDKNGGSVYTYQPQPKQVVSPEASFLISSILSDTNARAETFGNALTISRPAAVKTGTTNDYKDALTIGYTPSFVVGVWVGNNDNKPMDSIAGSLGAAPIWRLIMEQLLRGTKIEKFTKPSDILQVTICKENGLRAEGATTSAMTEYFMSGTIPTKSCSEPFPSITETPTATPTQTQSQPQLQDATPTPTPFPTDTPAPISPTPTLIVLPTL